jgi:zinc protease
MKADAVVSQIRAAFAKSKAMPLAPMVLPREPRQTGPRETIEEASIELGFFHYAWHIPDIRHPDMPALDVLASLLGSGRSSRLFREVREKQGLVTSADAWTYCATDQGLFGMSAVVDAEKFAASRNAMIAEIERVQNEPIPAEEVAKVVKQFAAGMLSTRKTMQGQAQDLGSNWMAANDLNFSERYLAAARQVTPATLQRVAREYLTPDNRTFYALLPQGAVPRIAGTVHLAAENAVQKIEFPNGLRLLVKEDHRLPFVEMRAVFQGGVLAETDKNNGLTQLMTKMLLQGTGKRSAEQISTEIESVGGNIETFGGNNSFGLSAEVLSEDLKTGFEVFADVLLNPAFPAEAFERERRIQLELIRSQKDHLLQSCSQAMRRGLFGSAGYGLDPAGSEESVKAIPHSAMSIFYRRMVVPNNCVMAIFGDVHTAELKASIEKYFGRWKAGDAVIPPATKPLALSGIKRLTEIRDKEQAVLLAGFPGTTLKDPDRYALELLQEGCSDLGSRLFLRIREKLGLAYYVGAQNFLGVAPGFFAFYAGTAREKLRLVEEEFINEVKLLCSEGFTDEELKRCKAKIVGQKKIARQDLGGYAITVALDELYGLGHQHIDQEDARYEAVTHEEIKAVARKYLTADALVLAVITPPESKAATG